MPGAGCAPPSPPGAGLGPLCLSTIFFLSVAHSCPLVRLQGFKDAAEPLKSQGPHCAPHAMLPGCSPPFHHLLCAQHEARGWLGNLGPRMGVTMSLSLLKGAACVYVGVLAVTLWAAGGPAWRMLRCDPVATLPLPLRSQTLSLLQPCGRGGVGWEAGPWAKGPAVGPGWSKPHPG